MEISPILLEIFKNKFSSIAEEMGKVLTKTAFSPNIKERQDASCAIFNQRGELIEQAAHIPVHLGSMNLSVKSAIKEIKDIEDGDMIILNDPYRGGTHLPDITIVAPIFHNSKEPIFFVANRAHHADIGGISPGSMPLSTSIFQEGIIIPPIKIVKRGKIDEDVLKLLLNNVRTPKEREGDFKAQIMANIVGIRRLKELIEKYGKENVINYGNALIDYAERIMRNTIKRIKDGEYEFEDYLDDDGIEETPIKLKVKINIKDDKIKIDFTGSSDSVKGPMNAVYSITTSAVLYVMRSIVKDTVPTNEGIIKPIEIITRKGSILDSEFPAPVSAGNVETSQRIVDLLLGALSKALKKEIPAASQGTMNNIAIGGMHKGKAFTYYETIGGGMGASPYGDGESGIHSHMTNTKNTPIEVLESVYPFMVREYSIRKGSGGGGKFKGGDGIVRDIEFLEDVEISLITERRKFAPYGLFGGSPGKTGKNLVITNDGKEIEVMPKYRGTLKKGYRLRIETPGGGGWGKD